MSSTKGQEKGSVSQDLLLEAIKNLEIESKILKTRMQPEKQITTHGLMKAAIDLEEARKLMATARQSQSEATRQRMLCAMTRFPFPRVSTELVFFDEEGDRKKISEYLEASKNLPASDTHHPLAKKDELILLGDSPHDILVQTSGGDIIWRQSTKRFRRAKSTTFQRARKDWDENATECDEDGFLMVDEYGIPVVIQQTMAIKVDIFKEKVVKTPASKKLKEPELTFKKVLVAQEFRRKMDGKVIGRWSKDETEA